jgi:heme A synthase
MQPFSFPQWMHRLAAGFALVIVALVIMAPLGNDTQRWLNQAVHLLQRR